uniref:Uncharacterized protein n=1 Tax=Aegilops tauschii subsp. strangulata TaxID=200361 RepID=A0A453FYI3_AEGTS
TSTVSIVHKVVQVNDLARVVHESIGASEISITVITSQKESFYLELHVCLSWFWQSSCPLHACPTITVCMSILFQPQFYLAVKFDA